MTYVLVGALIAATGAVVTFALLSRKDGRALIAARDLLNGEQRVSAEWESKYKATTAKLIVVEVSKKHESDLRAVAEVQRNAAQARVRELLRRHMGTATNEEIQELTNEAFSSPLSVVPRPADGVPQAVPRSEARDTALVDPWASVQPAKPPR